MKITFRSIVGKFHKLDLIRHIFAHKLTTKVGLYMGQLPLLEYIIEHDQCTQKEVADEMQVSPPSIAISVKRMQKAGLLIKVTDENNLRCNKLSVTSKGRERAKQLRKEFNKLDEQMFCGFNEDELDKLCSYLDRLVDNISSEEFANKTIFSLIALEKELERKQDNQKVYQEELSCD